jgi:hypothetical protein
MQLLLLGLLKSMGKSAGFANSYRVIVGRERCTRNKRKLVWTGSRLIYRRTVHRLRARRCLREDVADIVGARLVPFGRGYARRRAVLRSRESRRHEDDIGSVVSQWEDCAESGQCIRKA